MIPYGRQHIEDEDIQAVVEVLSSKMLTQGPMVPAFEEEICSRVGAKYGVAVNSATSALHISCKALGLGPGDILWTVPNSFVASANVGLLCGAEVDFVDIDPNTYVMDIYFLEQKLKESELKGKLPKIVMPVHFAGQSVDMKPLRELSIRYDFKVLEDASHAIGGKYLNKNVGSCTYSDITVFSFHPVKIITTGEGGSAVTNDFSLFEKLTLLRSHGVTRSPNLMESSSPKPWQYDQIGLGLNYRMTDIHAALGISQIKRLERIIQRRHEIANCYDKELADLDILLPFQASDSFSSLHLYPIQVSNREEIFHSLQRDGINVNVHYIPIHTQPFWRRKGFRVGDFPNSEHYYDNAISIPIYFGLSDEEQSYVISSIKKAFLAQK